MNNNLRQILDNRARITHGDKYDLHISVMREGAELMQEVSSYYLGEGVLFLTEEQSVMQGEISVEFIPWSYDCPFCDSSKKLFRVFDHLNLFYCFNCERYGDEIGLIKQMEMCSTDEAMDKLMEIYDYVNKDEDDE